MGGMGLREIGEKLPPGFRFYPSDEELVCHYLYKKVSYSNSDQLDLDLTLVDIDLHVCEPWQLPDVAKLNSNEWYFFSFRDRKYATGFRTNRATTSGYWKATGKDRPVFDPRTKSVVGMRKTLVFYKNRAPNGIKTAWIMHRAGPGGRLGSVRVFYKSRSENPNTAENESTSSLNHLGLNCAPAAYQNHCSTSQTAGKLQLEDDYRSFLFDFDASNDIISSSLFI